MGVYDQAARFATKAEPGFVLRRLQPITGLNWRFRRWQPTRGFPLPGGPDRDADLVAIADDLAQPEKPWLLIFENQTVHDESKPKVLHLEAMIFLCYARDTDRGGGEFRPLPVLVYLKEECPQANVEIVTPTGCGLVGKPALWEVCKDSAAEYLARLEADEITWGVLFWIALMIGANDDQVIDDWRHLLDSKAPAASRADVAYITLLFAELTGRRVAFNRVLQGVTMTESAVANEMIELGAMEMARQDLIRVIRLRFPTLLTPDVERAIADQPNLGLMKQWLDAAFEAATAEDFLAVLRR